MRANETWLTAKRLRVHAAILASCLWLVYGWNLATAGLRDRGGNLKGTDFLHFYTLGWLASEHRASDLYDMNAQSALAAQRVPYAAAIEYLPLYPPQVSILFAPLSHLPYGWALAVWWCFSGVVYGICCYSIWRTCPGLRHYPGTVVFLAAAYPAFFHLIAWGQTSALALACFTLTFLCLRERRNFLAGVFFGCLIFKPQVGLAAAIVFLGIGAWKVVLGALLAAGVQLGMGVLYYGIKPLIQWMHVLTDLGGALSLLEPKPYQTHSLRTFWSMIIPWNDVALVLYSITAIAALGATIAIWKRSQGATPTLGYSVLLLATVLVSPHLTVYDLVILAPAILLLADWAIIHPDSSRHLPALIYGTYLLPLAGPLTQWTHVQLSVIAMGALLLLIWRITKQADRKRVVTGQSKVPSPV